MDNSASKSKWKEIIWIWIGHRIQCPSKRVWRRGGKPGCINMFSGNLVLPTDSLEGKSLIQWPFTGHLLCGRCHVSGYMESKCPSSRRSQSAWLYFEVKSGERPAWVIWGWEGRLCQGQVPRAAQKGVVLELCLIWGVVSKLFILKNERIFWKKEQHEGRQGCVLGSGTTRAKCQY